MLPIPVPILLLCTALGLAMLATGLRARKLRKHPRCAECGAVLANLHPRIERCPSCGVDADAPGSVRPTASWRPRANVFSGALVLLLVLIWATTPAVLSLGGVEWYSRMPTSWVIRDARSADPGRSDRGLRELVERLRSDSVSPAKAEVILHHALRVQSEASAPWDPRWGRVIEILMASGVVSEQQTQSYLERSCQWALRIESPVVVGLPTSARLVGTLGRGDPVGNINVSLIECALWDGDTQLTDPVSGGLTLLPLHPSIAPLDPDPGREIGVVQLGAPGHTVLEVRGRAYITCDPGGSSGQVPFVFTVVRASATVDVMASGETEKKQQPPAE